MAKTTTEKLVAVRPTTILGITAKPGTVLGTIDDKGRIKPAAGFHEQLTAHHLEARMHPRIASIVRESQVPKPAPAPAATEPTNDGKDAEEGDAPNGQ